MPSRHNWEFVNWVKLPKKDTPEDYVEFRLKAQEPAKDMKKTWWIDENYLVKVNYRKGECVKE